MAVLALALAPAARAGCAARCATPAQQVAAPQAPAQSVLTQPAPTRPASALPDAAGAAGHQHAHQHGPRADGAPASPSAPAPAATVGGTRCGPADGRGCLVIRDTPAATAGRVVQDGVSLAAHAVTASPALPPAAIRPAHRTPPIPPPGPTAAPVPLRI